MATERPRRPLRASGQRTLLAAVATLLAACGDGGPTAPTPVADVAVSPASAIVDPGGTVQLSAKVTAANGQMLTGRAVMWTSANPAVAAVDSTGRVTGVDAGQTTITATAGGQSGSASVTVTATTATCSSVALAVGRETVVRAPADLCLQFPASASASAYLVGVQSVIENPASLTPLVLSGTTPGGTITSTPLPAPATRPRGAARIPGIAAAERERWQRREAAESALRSFERSHFGPRLTELRAAMHAAQLGTASAAQVPATVQVGDTVAIRVPNAAAGANVCTQYTSIQAVVRVIGQHGIWLEDTQNPAGGYTLTQIQSFSDLFDRTIYPTDVAWFGQPSDLDKNGRIVIVLSKEVNRAGGLLGFVTSADLVAPSTCPSSNQGEVFYGIVPDTGGVYGPKYTVSMATQDAPVVIAHEFTHDIQYSRRIANPNASAFQSSWEAEGQATLAEEVVGDAVLGHASGQNLGFSVAFNQPAEGPNNWYEDRFIDLADYYGFESQTSRVQGAPEQCTFLGRKDEGNSGPCIGNRPVYGTSWSFLRWLTDQFGPSYAGGEQGLQRALVDATTSGFAAIQQVVGRSVPDLLPQWAAMLYLDDRGVPGIDSRLLMTSWNLNDIFNNLVSTAQLTPYREGFGTFTDSVSVRGGSSAYFRVSGASRPATRLLVNTPSGGAPPSGIQLWVVRLQ